uniref:Ovule protein n=1 Tax=Strongyloides venezuelensis TaxID=75913 RepID=A0A0K0G5E5_STRVS
MNISTKSEEHFTLLSMTYINDKSQEKKTVHNYSSDESLLKQSKLQIISEVSIDLFLETFKLSKVLISLNFLKTMLLLGPRKSLVHVFVNRKKSLSL